MQSNDTCWEWTGYRLPSGYGQCGTGVRGGHEYAHRRAWVQASGKPIPEGLGVYHTCDNRPCIRNDEEGTYEVDGRLFPRWGHLWIGTDADNVADKVAKGRHLKGEQISNARLTESSVVEAHRLWATGTLTVAAIAKRFGVNRATMSDVLRGATWAHLLPEGFQKSDGRARNGLPPTLPSEHVDTIRLRYSQGGITQRELAQEYGVSPATISSVITRQRGYH